MAVASEVATSGAAPAQGWINALGGARNLISVDACTTRLRLVIADQNAVREAELKRLGARGIVRPSSDTLQVVVGPIADQLAGEIRAGLSAPVVSSAPVADSGALLTALGGAANIEKVDVHATRISVTLRDAASVTAAAIRSAGARGAVAVGDSTWHVIIGPQAAGVAQALRPA